MAWQDWSGVKLTPHPAISAATTEIPATLPRFIARTLDDLSPWHGIIQAGHRVRASLSRGRPQTLVQLLQLRASQRGSAVAYHFLPTGDVPGEVEELTYQELDRQARAIAASLQKLEAHGERALLLFPPGLEFVAAFFGCLYSGTTAVHCGARYVLTTAQLGQRAGAVLPRTEGLGALTWIHTDVIAPGTEDGWRAPPLTSESTAFLQYTSGSTGNPKGVIVSHGNILHNESLIMAAFPQSERSVTVSWLPPY